MSKTAKKRFTKSKDMNGDRRYGFAYPVYSAVGGIFGYYVAEGTGKIDATHASIAGSLLGSYLAYLDSKKR